MLQGFFMWFVLCVRFRQLIRLLQAAGWGILLVLLVVTAGLWIPLMARFSALNVLQVAVLGLFSGSALQLFRPDFRFLRQAALPAWRICLLDTLLLLSPFAVLLLVFGNWPAALTLPAGGLLANWLPAGRMAGALARKARFTLPFLPPDLFEFHTAVRRYPPAWLLVAALQAGSGFHIAFFLVAVALGLLLLGTVFEFAEPKELLPSGKPELWRKWRRNSAAIQFFFLPAYGLALFGQPEYAWLVLYAALSLAVLLTLLFFYKYSVWQPGLERLGGGPFAAIGMLCVLLPGGILIALPMSIWTARKAFRRMTNWWAEFKM